MKPTLLEGRFAPRRATALLMAFVLVIACPAGCASRSVFLQEDVSRPDVVHIDGSVDRTDSPLGAPFGGHCGSNADCASGMCLAGICSEHCTVNTDCHGGHGWFCLPSTDPSHPNWCACHSLPYETCNGLDDNCNGQIDDGASCLGYQSCIAGACICPSDRMACVGICTDLQSDPQHCGSCMRQCPEGVCTAGVCGCPRGQTLCNRRCVDLQSDATACGSCTSTCAPSLSCISGRCTCAPGETRCGSICVQENSDPQHCGSCNNQCSPGATCVSGACRCPAERPLACGSQCVDPTGDARNCGGCRNECPSGSTCVGGRCGCPAAFPDICGSPTRFCTNLQTEQNNCGSCGTVCDRQCFEGSCIRVHSIGAGPGFICATLEDGRVLCRGDGTAGQYGDGTYGAGTAAHVAQGIVDAEDIVVGTGFACALRTGGQVACWGQNDHGQLGDGTGHRSSVPVGVSGLSNVVQLTAGGAHVCARRGDGALWCWGSNASGQLGVSGPSDRLAPVLVPVSVVNDVDAGEAHTCAVIAGAPFCWGRNDYGQLGRGTYSDHESPGPVMYSGGVLTVTTGARHTCLLTSARSVVCWGDGRWGASGVVSPALGTAVPTVVPTLVDMRWLRSGPWTNCVSTPSEVFCWGRNDTGQVGPPPTESGIPIPTRPVDARISDVTLAETYSCGLQDGLITCWGDTPVGHQSAPTVIRF